MIGALVGPVAALRRPASAQGDPPTLQLEYEASLPIPTPPPLEPARPARIVVEFSSGPRGAECRLGVRARLDGEPALLALAVWTPDGASYWRKREGLRLPAFRGRAAWDGGRWSLTVRGRPAFSATPGDNAGLHERLERALPWLNYRPYLAADWTGGPLSGDPVALWSERSADLIANQPVDPEGCRAAGDLDGWLPKVGARRLVGARFLSATGAATWRKETETAPERYEPYAFRRYRGGADGMPPETLHAETAELDRYRARSEIRQSGLVVVSVDCRGTAAAIGDLLPPPCEPLEGGAVRVLTFRGLAEPGLDEAWLLLECVVGGSRAWYAASHLRPSLEHAAFGREVFGHPTQQGSVQASLGGNRFSAGAERQGRPLYRAWGSYGGFSTGTTIWRMQVAALRIGPSGAGGAPDGEVVVQPWQFFGLRQPVVSGSLRASFEPPEPGVRPRPWNRVATMRAASAMVMDAAGIRRLPARVAARVSGIERYYRDRCSGHLPWDSDSAGLRSD